MPSCDNCDGFVSASYHRVFEVDGVLHDCHSCENLDGNHGPDDVSRLGYTGR